MRKEHILIIFLILLITVLTAGRKLNVIYTPTETFPSSFEGPTELLISPEKPGEYHIGGISEDTPQILELRFGKPEILAGFSIFFPGNFHSVSSYLPEDFDVEIKKPDQPWLQVKTIRNNKNSVYTLRLPENTEIESFRITFLKAKAQNAVLLKNLTFLESQRVSVVVWLSDLLSRNSKSLLGYIFYCFLFYNLIFLSGYVLANFIQKVAKKELSPEIKFVFGPVLILVVLGLSGLIFYYTKLELFLYIPLPLLAFSIISLVKNHFYRDLKILSFSIFLTIAATAISLTVQAKRDYLFNLNHIERYLDKLEKPPSGSGYFGYHVDNTRTWSISRIIVNKIPIESQKAEDYLLGGKPSSIFDRTPMLSLILAPILKTFGESHFIYQRFTNVLVSLYFLAIYTLISILVSKNTSRTVGLMMLINIPFLFMVSSTEVHLKYIAFYPVLLGITLLKSDRIPITLLGTLFALAFFLHPLTLIPISSVGLYYFYKLRDKKKLLEALILTFLPTLILFILWRSFSENFLEKEYLATNIYSQSLLALPYNFLQNRGFNILNLFVPDFFLSYHKSFFSIDYLSGFIKLSLIAYVTPLFFLYFCLKLKKIISSGEYSLPLWFLFIPMMLFLLIYTGNAYGIFSALFPLSVPLSLGIIIHQLRNESKRKTLLLLLSYFLFMVAELYFVSDLFTGMTYSSTTITLLQYTALGFFITLSMMFLKQGVNGRDCTNH